MDGSHSKDSIPLEPEGYPRFEYIVAVLPGQPLFYMCASFRVSAPLFGSSCGLAPMCWAAAALSTT